MSGIQPSAQPVAPPPSPSSTPSPDPGPSSLLNEQGGPVQDGVSLLNDEKPGLKPEGEAPAEAKTGAPEAYAQFSAPEGYELDAKAIEEVTPIFKELNLSQEQGQKLIDFYSKLSAEAAEAPQRLVREQNEAWVNEIKADPQLGPKLAEVRSTVSKMLSSLGELEAPFRQAMDYTGAGNNPAFIRALYKIAGQLTEGGMVRGGGPSAQGQGNQGRPASAAAALYPNLPS